MQNLKIDFNSSQFLRKLESARQGAQPLKKALLIQGKTCTVIDATAGRGHDAFLIASWGFNVKAYERNPEVWAQLSQALTEIKTGTLPAQILNHHLEFIFGDSLVAGKPVKSATVFLDPMYEPKKKSAASTKEILNLREIVGHQPESLEELLEKALDMCEVKVVLKRPIHEAIPFKPSYSVDGSSTRYDVFLKSSGLKKT